jgi:hypothetical protein
MPRTELQINTKRHLTDTLGDMASAERQTAYKNSVPYVFGDTDWLELGPQAKALLLLLSPES